MVFEIDRFRIVHPIDVPTELLAKTPPDPNALPLTGPTPLAVRPFRDSQEMMETTIAALQGIPLAARPDLWQPYASAVPEVLWTRRAPKWWRRCRWIRFWEKGPGSD